MCNEKVEYGSSQDLSGAVSSGEIAALAAIFQGYAAAIEERRGMSIPFSEFASRMVQRLRETDPVLGYSEAAVDLRRELAEVLESLAS